jgi:hypothetical protein
MALNKITDKIMGFPDWHATCLDDYIEWVEVIKKHTRTETLIFRGQQKNWPLLPSISRNGLPSEIIQNEKKVLTQFRKEGEACLHLPPSNDWDWLVVAQHHGLPTRLLDWSYDPMIALWFALEKCQENGSKPEVWALTPLKEDFIEDLEKSEPFRGSRTKIFETNFTIPRVRAQKGCFVLFKHSEKFPKGFIPIEKNTTLRKRLERVRIAEFSSHKIYKQLESRGLNKDKIYPDIDRVANRIKHEIFELSLTKG